MMLGTQDFTKKRAVAKYLPLSLALVKQLRDVKTLQKLTVQGLADAIGLSKSITDKVLTNTVATISPANLKKIERYLAQNTDLSTTS